MAGHPQLVLQDECKPTFSNVRMDDLQSMQRACCPLILPSRSTRTTDKRKGGIAGILYLATKARRRNMARPQRLHDALSPLGKGLADRAQQNDVQKLRLRHLARALHNCAVVNATVAEGALT